MNTTGTNRSSSMQGWTCSNCGVFVPGGTTHSCRWNFGNLPPASVPTTVASNFYLTLSDADIDKIARRVVQLLDERESSPPTRSEEL